MCQFIKTQQKTKKSLIFQIIGLFSYFSIYFSISIGVTEADIHECYVNFKLYVICACKLTSFYVPGVNKNNILSMFSKLLVVCWCGIYVSYLKFKCCQMPCLDQKYTRIDHLWSQWIIRVKANLKSVNKYLIHWNLFLVKWNFFS